MFAVIVANSPPVNPPVQPQPSAFLIEGIVGKYVIDNCVATETFVSRPIEPDPYP